MRRPIALLLVGGFLSLACEAELGSKVGPTSPRNASSGDSLGSSSGSDGKGEGGASAQTSGGKEPSVEEACETRTLSPEPLRRLSSEQYLRTLADLFGSQLAGPLLKNSIFPTTSIEAGFASDAEANIVNASESDAIIENAQRIGAAVIDDPEPFLEKLVPCSLDQGFDDSELDACIEAFVDDFGKRAYRRPLTDAERSLLLDLYDDVRDGQSAVEAFSALIQFFVQSPALLYRVERGTEVVPDAALLRLSDYEMATRLSYFLTGSMPDEELMQAADEGKLSEPSDVLAQARRIVRGEHLLDTMAGFHRDWLRLYGLESAPKDVELFPEFTSAAKNDLLSETREFLRYVLDETDHSLKTLLSEDRYPITKSLAPLYGVDAPDDDWAPVSVPHRKGLLTQASFMAATSGAEQTSPIHRGAFFVKEVLCMPLRPLPGNVDLKAPLQDTSTLPTARMRLEPLLTRPDCSHCHQAFNPTGLSLENFDALGQFRSQENGEDIDPSGEIYLDGEVTSFDDAQDLMSKVAESQDARVCYAQKWFENAMGRNATSDDSCSLATVNEHMEEAQGDIVELMLAIVTSDAFMYRAPLAEASGNE